MNNNIHKSPALDKDMSNTTHKTAERRFQEERRDVMKMDKLFAGLIAFVAGVALSAGSAFAQTNGYMVGDQANMKLVPHYETGDNRATIIGIQNLSPQEASTVALNQDVTDLETYLAGTPATAAMVTNLNAADIDLTADVVVNESINKDDLNEVAEVEKALEKAQGLAYTEHMFISVSAYDAMGMMMEDTKPVSLCLAENQFGVVVLQGGAAMGTPSLTMKTLSVADGDIAANGYVMIAAGTKKYDGCVSTTPDGLTPVDDDTDSTNPIGATENEVAAWTIIQDIGEGFFGTEVPTATISMASHVGADGTAGNADDGDPEVACYTAADNAGTGTTPAANETANTSGAFMMTRCGLIPERHNILLTGTAPNRTVDTVGAANTAGDSSTMPATVTARYDAGDESMVYVWLAKNMDTEDTLPKDRRMIEVSVICEDGTTVAGADTNGDNKPDPIKVAAPTMVTMIDPNGDELGSYTDMCEGVRGVLSITMPDNSHAGMVFTHISQMMDHYRMNFPGYSMTSLTETDDAS